MSTSTVDFSGAPTPVLNISQGPLLPPVKEKPITADTGYTEMPDSLTTSGYTTQPRIVQYPHPTDPSKQGATVMFPADMDETSFHSAAKAVWSQLKGEVGALSQGLGGPSTLKEAYQDVKNAPAGFAHPYESLKAAVSGIVGGLNSGPMLDAAKQSWDAGDKVTATRHFVNALIPFVGANADLAGDELTSGQTGKAVGHTLAAVAPFILGATEKPTERAVAQSKGVASAEPTVKPGKAAHAEVAPTETTERPALLSAAELEDAIRNRQPVRTPVDETPGAQATAVSYQDAEKSVLKDFEPSNVSRDEFEDNLAKLNKRLPISEDEATPGKVANALIKRHIADSVNPEITREFVLKGAAPLQDLYGDELAKKSIELDPNPRAIPSHEAAHAVLAHHYGAPITEANLYPKFARTSKGTPRLSSATTDVNLDNLSKEQKATVLMGGVEGEKVAGFKPKTSPVSGKGDMSILQSIFSDEDAAAASASGQAEANRLLTGELAGKHQQLTDVFREQFGKKLKFEDFKHILGSIGVAVTAPQLMKLWGNYKKPGKEQP